MPLSTNFTRQLKCLAASQLWGDTEELGQRVQSFPFGRYNIFYRAVIGAIEIVRVLHGARDIETIFGG